jgi:hypothetical protein
MHVKTNIVGGLRQSQRRQSDKIVKLVEYSY